MGRCNGMLTRMTGIQLIIAVLVTFCCTEAAAAAATDNATIILPHPHYYQHHDLAVDLVGTMLATVFSRSLVFGGFWWLVSIVIRVAMLPGTVTLGSLPHAPFGAAILGLTLGLGLSRLLRLPRLIDPLLMPDHPGAKRALIIDVPLWVGVIALLSVATRNVVMSGELTRDWRHLGSPVGQLAVAVALFVWALFWLLHSEHDAFTKGQNVKYTTALLVLVLLPAVSARAMRHATATLQFAKGDAEHALPSILFGATSHVLVAVLLYVLFFWYAGHVGLGSHGERPTRAWRVHTFYLVMTRSVVHINASTSVVPATATPSPPVGSAAVYPVEQDEDDYAAYYPDLEHGLGNHTTRHTFELIPVVDRIATRGVAMAFTCILALCHVSIVVTSALLSGLLGCPSAGAEVNLLLALVLLWIGGLWLITLRSGQDVVTNALSILATAPSWSALWRIMMTPNAQSDARNYSRPYGHSDTWRED